MAISSYYSTMTRQTTHINFSLTAVKCCIRLSCNPSVLKDVTREIFLEVIKDECVDISSLLLDGIRRLLNTSQILCQDLLVEVTNDMLQAVVREAVHEAMMLEKELRARQRALNAAAGERTSNLLTAEFIETAVNSIGREIAGTVYKEFVDREALESRFASDISLELLVSVTAHESALISNEIYENDVVKRLELLERCCRMVELRRTRHVLNVWKTRLRDLRKLKRSIETFPSLPSLHSWNYQLARLMPEPSTRVSMSDSLLHVYNPTCVTMHCARTFVDNRQKLLDDLSMMKLAHSRKHEAAWSPLDLTEIFAYHLPQSSSRTRMVSKKIYWKLVVFEPLAGYNENNRHFARWLRTKLSKGAVPSKRPESKVEVCSLYTSEICGSPIGVCTLSIEGDMSANELQRERHLLGTSGFIFLVSCNDTSSVQMWRSESERLRSLLAAKLPEPRTPLLVLCFGITEDAKDAVADELCLEQLVASGTVSTYSVCTLDGDVVRGDASAVLRSGLQWLWQQSSNQLPEVKSRSLYDYVEDHVASSFVVPVLQFVAERRKQGLGHLDPNTIINWYNDVISWLANMATHPVLRRVSWPVSEFLCDNEDLMVSPTWNTDASMDVLHDVIMSMTLSEMDVTPVNDLWSAATDDVWCYVIDLVSRRNTGASQLWSRIKHILKATESEFDKIVQNALGVEHSGVTYECMPWADVVIACVEHQLIQLLPSQLSGHDGRSVHYLPDLLKNYPPPSLGLPAVYTNVSEETKLAESLLRTAVKRKQEVIDQCLSKRRDISLHQSTSSPLDTSWATSHNESPVGVRRTTSSEKFEQLHRSISEEQSESQAFEKYLMTAMLIDEHTSNGEKGNLSDQPGNNVGDTQDHAGKGDGRQLIQSPTSLRDRIDSLNAAVKSEKDADRLFELRLQSVLQSS